MTLTKAIFTDNKDHIIFSQLRYSIHICIEVYKGKTYIIFSQSELTTGQLPVYHVQVLSDSVE